MIISYRFSCCTYLEMKLLMIIQKKCIFYVLSVQNCGLAYRPQLLKIRLSIKFLIILFKGTSMSYPSQMYFTKNTQRRSFKNHQTIKRKCYCTFHILVILIITIIYQFFVHYPSQTQQYKNHEQNSKDLTKSDAAQLYLKNYCNNSSCQQQSIDALTSILSLMQNQPQIIQSPSSSPSSSPTQQQQILAPALPSSNIQKPHQLQINSNTLDQQLNYKLSLFEQTNGQSKLIQIPLFVIKHHKVTTPIQYSFAQKITSIFKHFDSYENIDKIVSNQDEGASWNPNSRIVSIAVRSNNLIQPISIEIEVVDRNTVSLQLIGLNISIDKNILLVPLGRFEITEGINSLTCLQPQCNEGHQAIIFKFPNTSIGKIRIFQSISL